MDDVTGGGGSRRVMMMMMTTIGGVAAGGRWGTRAPNLWSGYGNRRNPTRKFDRRRGEGYTIGSNVAYGVLVR